jgi:hypothetical protein
MHFAAKCGEVMRLAAPEKPPAPLWEIYPAPMEKLRAPRNGWHRFGSPSRAMRHKHPHETSEATMHAYRFLLLVLLWIFILLWISPLAGFARTEETAIRGDARTLAVDSALVITAVD